MKIHYSLFSLLGFALICFTSCREEAEADLSAVAGTYAGHLSGELHFEGWGSSMQESLIIDTVFNGPDTITVELLPDGQLKINWRGGLGLAFRGDCTFDFGNSYQYFVERKSGGGEYATSSLSLTHDIRFNPAEEAMEVSARRDSYSNSSPFLFDYDILFVAEKIGP